MLRFENIYRVLVGTSKTQWVFIIPHLSPSGGISYRLHYDSIKFDMFNQVSRETLQAEPTWNILIA